jgi:uncharacterized Tic20 family protein
MSYEQVGDPEFAEPATVLTNDERLWAMFCHLSAILSHWAFAGFLLPLVLWLVKKDESKFVDFHGKESVNFQLNLLGYGLILALITVATCFMGLIITLPLAGAIGIYALIMEIVAGIKAHSGEYFRYPAIIRLIK